MWGIKIPTKIYPEILERVFDRESFLNMWIITKQVLYNSLCLC